LPELVARVMALGPVITSVTLGNAICYVEELLAPCFKISGGKDLRWALEVSLELTIISGDFGLPGGAVTERDEHAFD